MPLLPTIALFIIASMGWSAARASDDAGERGLRKVSLPFFPRMISWGGEVVGCFDWIRGIEREKDVTTERRYWGGFEVGAIYRLKHGVYIYKPDNSDRPALNAPTNYGTEALEYAVRKYGAVEDIPPEIEYSEEFLKRMDGPPPVESLPQGHVPKEFEATVAAGVRLKVISIIREAAGDRRSLEIVAEVLEGPFAGELFNISPLTNYGFRGFETPQGGYSPNPLILEKVIGDDLSEAGQKRRPD